MRGITIGPIESSRWPGRGYRSPYSEEQLDELARMGTNWISITPFGHIWSLTSTDIDVEHERLYVGLRRSGCSVEGKLSVVPPVKPAVESEHVHMKVLLENFVSDDRSRTSPDGKTFTKLRFSTPVSHYRSYGPYRLAAHGEARWHPSEGEFTYGEFELLKIAYNITR